MEYFKIRNTMVGINFKGQIKPKADWHIVDSPRKGTNEFGHFFALKSEKAKKKKKIFFCENLRRANLLTDLSDL